MRFSSNQKSNFYTVIKHGSLNFFEIFFSNISEQNLMAFKMLVHSSKIDFICLKKLPDQRAVFALLSCWKKKSKPNIFRFSSSKNIAFCYTISLSNLCLMKIYVNCNYIPLHQLLNSVDTRAGNSNLQNVWGTNKAQRYIP